MVASRHRTPPFPKFLHLSVVDIVTYDTFVVAIFSLRYTISPVFLFVDVAILVDDRVYSVALKSVWIPADMGFGEIEHDYDVEYIFSMY